jgi:hypothetical protein
MTCKCECKLTNKPHKHAKLIKAWADGAEIEYLTSRECKGQEWITVPNPSWTGDQYRIKPESKPDIVLYANALPLKNKNYATVSDAYCYSCEKNENLKLTYDGKTGKLKAVELI